MLIGLAIPYINRMTMEAGRSKRSTPAVLRYRKSLQILLEECRHCIEGNLFQIVVEIRMIGPRDD